ncbi:MAG: ABC transporter substrate-binding protein [Afipia sp.]|nr:ABC transporter substrate-binding protein [Afipia sp.]
MFKSLKLALALLLGLSGAAFAADTPGVTAAEIKVGGVFPFSGPASSIGLVGKGVLAYVQSINDRGGINGRKINYIAYDDAYSPPKAVEHVRKLVESDEVAFMFGQLGTPGNTATAKYLTSKKVPALGIVSGSNKFTDVVNFPVTTTSLVSFVTEGKIYAKFLNKTLPGKKYAILYQNDDLGKDYVIAFKEFMKDEFDKRVVTAAYEIADPTVDSQIVNLKSTGADALLVAGTPKFAAQAIRKASEIGWKPTLILNYPSSSVGATLKPAGLDKSVGVIVGTFTKDPTDTKWDKDKGMNDYRAFIDKYMPGVDISDGNYLFGYTQGMILEQIIKQCGNDLSRANILKQAKNLKGIVLPTVLPGVLVNTSEAVNQDFTQMRLQRWTGDSWDQFSEVLDAKSE